MKEPNTLLEAIRSGLAYQAKRHYDQPEPYFMGDWMVRIERDDAFGGDTFSLRVCITKDIRLTVNSSEYVRLAIGANEALAYRVYQETMQGLTPKFGTALEELRKYIEGSDDSKLKAVFANYFFTHNEITSPYKDLGLDANL